MDRMIIKRRLALTEDREQVVPYEAPEARYLFAILGQEIPDALGKKYGLVDGDIPGDDEEPKEPEEKKAPKPPDKKRGKPPNKGLKDPPEPNINPSGSGLTITKIEDIEED